MRTQTRVGLKGKTITIWIPESAEDRAALAAKATAEGFDVAASFGDQPEQRRRLDRLRRLARRIRATRPDTPWEGPPGGQNRPL